MTRRGAIRRLALLLAGLGAGSRRAVAEEAAPLAIQGYDPVAYFRLGKAQPGRPDIEYEWDERRYRFLTRAHRDLFQANPVRYAPQFPNVCAMSLANGEVVDANPEYWLIADGKLYMFGKPAGPALFKQALAENVAQANKNRNLLQRR